MELIFRRHLESAATDWHCSDLVSGTITQNICHHGQAFIDLLKLFRAAAEIANTH